MHLCISSTESLWPYFRMYLKQIDICCFPIFADMIFENVHNNKKLDNIFGDLCDNSDSVL